jgi:hypothetical protein
MCNLLQLTNHNNKHHIKTVEVNFLPKTLNLNSFLPKIDRLKKLTKSIQE